MKIVENQLIINSYDLSLNDFEALESFAEEYNYLPIGKLVQKYIDNIAWDFAVCYIGEDI